jgi:hypothetical protein
VWFSPLVDRIAGRGAGAWSIHMEAARLRDQGQDVIFLTVVDATIGVHKIFDLLSATLTMRAHRRRVEPNRNPPLQSNVCRVANVCRVDCG